jgi:ATP-dependent DNA helicase MPH1
LYVPPGISTMRAYDQLEFSLGMFHTSLTEIAGGQNEAGKKSGSKAGAGGIRNNFEFQKLLRDVEAEMNLIRIGKDGRTKADRHPKMVQTLQLVCLHTLFGSTLI